MANRQLGGFRWSRNKSDPNAHSPPINLCQVATSYATKLASGDPVKMISDGTITIAGAGDTVYGVVSDVAQYYDGTVVRAGGSLPASTAWGTNFERRSVVRVIPVRDQIFLVCADDATTFTTAATYQAAVQENCEMVAGTSVGDQSGYLLDISTHATTNTLSLRIESLVSVDVTDFSSIYVPLEVSFNLMQDTGSGSTTGT